MRATTASERGSVLVEFALVSLVLMVILAATVDFGRLMFSAQGVQDAARVAARELSVAPLPADMTFDCAVYGACDETVDPALHEMVRERIYNPDCLVIDLAGKTDADLDAIFAALPVVNKTLRALMIVDQSGGLNLLRYPGALLSVDPSTETTPPCDSGYTVGIPEVTARDANGVETIRWIDVLEEIRSDPADPTTGPFSLQSTNAQASGLAAVRINYPYQAATMSGFRQNAGGPFEPNLANRIQADDSSVTEQNAPPRGGATAGDPSAIGPYAGTYGLGRQLAFAENVRPFRKLISAQSIYRREVFQ
jgi:hypothetical protein